MPESPIARSARRLRMLVFAGIALVITVYLVGLSGLQLGSVRVETEPDTGNWQGQLVVGLSLLLFVIALARLAQMLSAIAEGPLFGPRVTGAFRGFAFWLFLATLVDVVAGPALAIAGHLPSDNPRVELTFELRDLLMLAGALFLFLLARMLEQARSIEAELEEIV